MIRLRERRKSGKGKCSFVALGRDEATPFTLIVGNYSKSKFLKNY
jgi:hypothetical protein